jgi:hypothetical protein
MLQSMRLVPTEIPISELRLARFGRRGALLRRGRTPSDTQPYPRCTRLVDCSRPDTSSRTQRVPPGRRDRARRAGTSRTSLPALSMTSQGVP